MRTVQQPGILWRLLLGSLLLLGGGTLSLSAPSPVSAHQPIIVDSATTEVTDPEISKAYYGTLSGEPHRYTINATVAFDLYVNLLVPDDGSPVKDVSAVIFRDQEPLARLGGPNLVWEPFYERFGGNTYLDGGEDRLRAEPGIYTIIVSSVDNTSSYSLAIGEIEFFSWGDRVNALAVLPVIQQEFFGRSPLSLLATPYGLINLLVIYAVALVTTLLYRLLLRRPLLRLIGERRSRIDRRARGLVGLALFVVSITTSWSPLLLFLSGLLLIEALLPSRSGAQRAPTPRRQRKI